VYIGVDGGGTRARAVLVDREGRVLRREEGPAGRVSASDPGRSVSIIAALVQQVSAGDRVAVLCCGLAGAGRQRERDTVRAGLEAAQLAESVIVVTDADAALQDAFGAGAGVLVIAGTGSIALARDEDGHAHRVGGWGHLLGDEGSGYAIGLAALRAVARAADGRDPSTALTPAVLETTACRAPDELIAFAASASKAEIAAIAPAVLHCAPMDAAASAIRADAVAALRELAVAAARHAGSVTPEFAFTGGLLAPQQPVRELLTESLELALPGCRVADRAVDGARGAASLALLASRR
jgi:N-acetylglucosamine kinase-like BadF-type ATPase